MLAASSHRPVFLDSNDQHLAADTPRVAFIGSELSPGRFLAASQVGLQAGIDAVRAKILMLHAGLETAEKKDGTIVTAADTASAEAIVPVIRCEYPEADVSREDGSPIKNKGYRIRFLIDPLDGTAPFASGAPTSSVIIAVYDQVLQRIVGCAIGDVGIGRYWLTYEGCDFAYVSCPRPESERARNIWNIHVANPQRQGTEKFPVYLDTLDFKPTDGRGSLNAAQRAALCGLVEQNYMLQKYGSNGLHQALVAQGLNDTVGSITTAIGGPWDVAGALLVRKAGGVARAFRLREQDGEMHLGDGGDPLAVLKPGTERTPHYDLLICANSDATGDRLENMVRDALSRG